MKRKFNSSKYIITRKMENLMLEILILKQLLDNKNISNRETLENNLKGLIDTLIVEFTIQNKE